MTIYDFDNDFAHYETNEEERKKLGQVWTPYYIIEQMMDKIGTVDDKNSDWYNENETDFDPTMGAGNIVIAILYRRIVQCGQNPVVALSNVYGVELDSKTLNYAKERIKKFMAHFTDEDLTKIIEHNFVCSDIFKWDIVKWKPKKSEVEEQTDVWHNFGVEV